MIDLYIEKGDPDRDGYAKRNELKAKLEAKKAKKSVRRFPSFFRRMSSKKKVSRRAPSQ